MISYCTNVNVNDDFNQEILINMFLNWLNHSKNKMNNLNYVYSSSFEYKEERKCLKMEDFDEVGVFGIQFITSDNYKKAQFIVEIMYDYQNQSLDLRFHKELNEDSKYISAISLPKIFVEILESSYVELSQEPIFMNRREFKEYMKQSHDIPLIVLSRQDKCCVNPFKLATKLFGLGRVICVYKHSNELTMDIYYPNLDIERIQEKKDMIMECFNALLSYSIQENSQGYMFDELMNARLQKKHLSSKELEELYENELMENEYELQEYEQYLKHTQSQYDKCVQELEELEKKLNALNKENLIISNSEDLEKQKLLLEIIKKSLNSLASTEVYQKEMY